jgi:hypothetical protein
MIRDKVITIMAPSIVNTLTVPERIALSYLLLAESGFTLEGYVSSVNDKQINEELDKAMIERFVSDSFHEKLEGVDYLDDRLGRTARQVTQLRNTFERALDTLSVRAFNGAAIRERLDNPREPVRQNDQELRLEAGGFAADTHDLDADRHLAPTDAFAARAQVGEFDRDAVVIHGGRAAAIEWMQTTPVITTGEMLNEQLHIMNERAQRQAQVPTGE